VTFEKIKKIVADQIGLDKEEIKMSSTFKEDLGIDSLDIFEIVMELEEEFEIEIPTEDLEGMTRVEDIVRYIDSKIK